MDDDFYVLAKPTVKEIKKLIIWAKNNSLEVNVNMLDCKKSWARQKSDRTFEKVLSYIKRGSIDSFRVILRRDLNTFMILSDKKEYKDVVEVFIRSIDIDDKEYFFFIYLEVDKLKELKRKYKLKKLGYIK